MLKEFTEKQTSFGWDRAAEGVEGVWWKWRSNIQPQSLKDLRELIVAADKIFAPVHITLNDQQSDIKYLKVSKKQALDMYKGHKGSFTDFHDRVVLGPESGGQEDPNIPVMMWWVEGEARGHGAQKTPLVW